ncbi:MAG TPA: DUF4175 family protein [Gemmatimonadaceae bacterium]|nr:DUF4175 family protein [Gemmatimonadaceae bacterium]
MSVFSRLRFIRAILALGAVLRAMCWGGAVALSVFAISGVADSMTPLAVDTRGLLVRLSLFAAAVTAAAFAWRDRGVASLHRVALWIEEHDPTLQFALASAVETADERLVAGRDTGRWTRAAFRRSGRAFGIPLAAGGLVFLALLALPSGAIARLRAPRSGDALHRAGRRAPTASRLSPLVAHVMPPAYARQRDTTIDEPGDVHAIVGSVVEIEGTGASSGIRAIVAHDTLVAHASRQTWRVPIVVTARPMTVMLADRSYRRLVAIEPTVDNPPTVSLTAPARDSVFRAPNGRIALVADIVDDFAVASAWFEYIVSSGEGETFTFKSGTIGLVRPGGPRTTLKGSLALDSLGLKPGDIVHLRAVARDANDISGPGVGTSETRTIRIARAGEYDSLAVEAAAPTEADKSVISERMLITLAEALQRRRAGLVRDTVVRESRDIAIDQKRLRRSVGEIVFTRLGGDPTGEEHTDPESPSRAKTMEELIARADSATNRSSDPIDFAGGESPVVATNRPLLEAYNAMWDASTELEVGEPGRALPHMRRALDAIQRARQAERLYLRGRAPQVVLDLARIRLTGKDRGTGSVRRPIIGGDSAVQRLESRMLRAIDLASRNTAAAIDSLLVLRVDALSSNPPFASSLGDAANAMRKSNSAGATEALATARRLVAGRPVLRDSLSRWGLVP